MLWDGHPVPDGFLFYSSQLQREITALRREFQSTPYAWDPHELRWPVEVAHRLGMKFYAWVTIYNEGAPAGAYREYGVPPVPLTYPWGTIQEAEFPFESRFVHEHPEYQLVDRTGKRRHYGVLEWAYPEARGYWVQEIQLILDRYAVDGIHVSTRTEGPSPEHADQFGFNPPIVEEYRRRHGVDILREDFDVEQWRALRGEYLTRLLREISGVVHARGKQLSLGTSQGDYIGFPLGNMKLEWRNWIEKKIVDRLNLGEHGWGWGPQGYGYLTDFATRRGLKPLDAAVREDYGPLCKQHGVKLLFLCSPRLGPRPISDACCTGRASPSAYSPPANWCDTASALPEFDGTILQVRPRVLADR